MVAGCKASPAMANADAGADTGPPIDAGTPVCPSGEAGTPAGVSDEFGPNARAVSPASALGQLDLYEVTSPRRLEWVDLYLRADLPSTRLTIAVYEAPALNAAFQKLVNVQVDVPPCVGWMSGGPLAVPLEAGRFYAIGFDPNQAVTPFSDSETNDLPVDGQFGRLIGSKTATSVSVDVMEWGKPSDKDFTRQRLFTTPRAGSDAAPAEAPADASGSADAGVPRDAVADLRG